MKYSAAYFIRKFKRIAPKRWGMFQLRDERGRCCALGHCGRRIGDTVRDTPEALGLAILFDKHDLSVIDVNDSEPGRIFYSSQAERMQKMFPQKSPRARILAALRWIQKEESKQ